MGRPPRRQLPAGVSRREVILDAAMTLFADRGYHGTTVPMVYDRAGVSPGTLYQLFTSKEQLVNELFREKKTALLQHVWADVPVDQPFRARFRRLFQAYWGVARAQPDVLLFLELHMHGDYLDASSRRAEAETLEIFRAFFRGGQAEGVVREGDPDVWLALVWGAFLGTVRAARRDLLELDAEQFEVVERALWEIVRG